MECWYLAITPACSIILQIALSLLSHFCMLTRSMLSHSWKPSIQSICAYCYFCVRSLTVAYFVIPFPTWIPMAEPSCRLLSIIFLAVSVVFLPIHTSSLCSPNIVGSFVLSKVSLELWALEDAKENRKCCFHKISWIGRTTRPFGVWWSWWGRWRGRSWVLRNWGGGRVCRARGVWTNWSCTSSWC